MARPSIRIPDDLLDDFDEAVFERKVIGDLDRDATRSAVVRQLMREYIAETEAMQSDDAEG